MITVGKMSKQFAISRSTLLYYEQIGLLKPSARSAANYRLYTQADVARMEKIVEFREAGLSLENITMLLDQPGNTQQQILERRLLEINREVVQLRQQQQVIASLLTQWGTDAPSGLITKQQWVNTLRAAGLDETGMHRWHCEFERQSPDAHHAFLESLGIDDDEIIRIRQGSVAEG